LLPEQDKTGEKGREEKNKFVIFTVGSKMMMVDGGGGEAVVVVIVGILLCAI